MRFLPVVLLLAFALIFTVSVVDAQANSCGIGGRLGCIASCVAQVGIFLFLNKKVDFRTVLLDPATAILVSAPVVEQVLGNKDAVIVFFPSSLILYSVHNKLINLPVSYF